MKFRAELRVGAAFLAVILFGLTGCAHVRNDGRSLRPRTIADLLSGGSGSDRNIPSPKLVDYGPMTVLGVKLRNTKFDIPVAVNSRVEHWVDYFTGKGRGYFSRYLERSDFFIPYITPLLKQNGLPGDMVYLAMIESGFNNLARSHARAVGPWQFISATGKRYGLMVNWWVDERRDIRKSTLGAAEYLKDLYLIFGRWELAAAAYNAGEAKIARAVRRFGTRDFWEIARHRFLRPETRDYVPKIIAAAIISKNRDLFGFSPSNPQPGDGEVVAGDGALVKVIKEENGAEHPTPFPNDASDSAGTNNDEQNDITPATLTIPADKPSDGQVAAASASVVQASVSAPVAKPVPTPHVSKSGQVGGETLAEFEVQSPADLLKIARAAGLSYQTVKSLNPEILRWCTPPGAPSYRVKLPASVKDRFLETYNHEAFPRQVKFLTYKVRHGETLSRIARHFGIKVEPIADLNRLPKRARLRSGARVLLPMPNDRSRTMASLEIRDPPERRHHRRRRRRHRYYKISYKNRASSRSDRHNGPT